MAKYSDETQILAKMLISKNEAIEMGKCIGFKGTDAATYKPFHNNISVWNDDKDKVRLWKGLVDKGYAFCRNDQHEKATWKDYHLTPEGLNVLSAYHKVYIYSTAAHPTWSDNAGESILGVMRYNAVTAGAHEATTGQIANAVRLPKELTAKALRKLRDEGLVKRTSHGWIITDQALPKN